MERTEETPATKVSLTIRRRVWGGQPRFKPPLKRKSCPSTSVSSFPDQGDRAKVQRLEKALSALDRRITECHDDGQPYRDVFECSSSEEELPEYKPTPSCVPDLGKPTQDTSSLIIDSSFLKMPEIMGENCPVMPLTSTKLLSIPTRPNSFKSIPRTETQISLEEIDTMEESDDELMSQNKKDSGTKFYSAMFSKPSMKKHKTWDEDGFIIVSGINVVLKNTDGEVIGSSSKIELTEAILSECKPFRLGGKEVQIQEQVLENPFNETGPPAKDGSDEGEILSIYQPSTSKKILSIPTTHRPPFKSIPFAEAQVSLEDLDTLEENDSEQTLQSKKDSATKFYSAMFSKPSMKKHKTWDEDGFIIVSGIKVVLKNTDGQVIESSSKVELTEEILSECKPFRLGGKEVQIQDLVSENPFNETGTPAKHEPEEVEILSTEQASTRFKSIPLAETQISLEDLDTLGGNLDSELSETTLQHQECGETNDDELMSQNKKDSGTKFYSAMFSKPSMKKHKTWDEDGFIIVSGINVVLKNTGGRVIESSSKVELTEEILSECKPFRLGGKEVQIQEEVLENPFYET